MQLWNDETRHGQLSHALHWAIAGLIALLIPLGLFGRDPATSAAMDTRLTVLSAHKTLGLLLLVLAVLRLLLHAVQTRPRLPTSNPFAQLAGETAQGLLLLLTVLIPVTGLMIHAAPTSAAPLWLGLDRLLPLRETTPLALQLALRLHPLLNWLLWVVLAGHIAAALWHGARRDGVTAGMTRGAPRAGQPRRYTRLLPLTAAISVLTLTLGLAGQMGVLRDMGPSAGAAIPLPQSQWQVQDGLIGLRISQFGQPVIGRFGRFRADIRFDPEAIHGLAGHVLIRVETATLDLGALTAQALGPDFLDTTRHPEAVFEADLLRVADGYVAEGVLTLKGIRKRLSMPFQLTRAGSTARAEGALTLDRRSFDIAPGLDQPGQLGFDVQVAVTLTARRLPD